jgi:hypothetical protein
VTSSAPRALPRSRPRTAFSIGFYTPSRVFSLRSRCPLSVPIDHTVVGPCASMASSRAWVGMRHPIHALACYCSARPNLCRLCPVPMRASPARATLLRPLLAGRQAYRVYSLPAVFHAPSPCFSGAHVPPSHISTSSPYIYTEIDFAHFSVKVRCLISSFCMHRTNSDLRSPVSVSDVSFSPRHISTRGLSPWWKIRGLAHFRRAAMAKCRDHFHCASHQQRGLVGCQ